MRRPIFSANTACLGIILAHTQHASKFQSTVDEPGNAAAGLPFAVQEQHKPLKCRHIQRHLRPLFEYNQHKGKFPLVLNKSSSICSACAEQILSYAEPT
jgi:hypothetical protein